MDRIRLAGVLLLLLTASAGCRTNTNIALLERQNRLLEDEIYRLRECIVDYQTKLESGQADGRSQKLGTSASAQADTNPAEGDASLPPSAKPRTFSPPTIEFPDSPTTRSGSSSSSPNARGAGRMEPPTIEWPEESLTPGEVPPSLRLPNDAESPDNTGTPDDTDSSNEGGLPRPLSHVAPTSGSRSVDSSTDAQRGSSQVQQVVLLERLTGGYNTDGEPGDEGIIVRLQPRDAVGQAIPVAGAISVALIDPAVEGDDARVARWDFSAKEAASRLYSDHTGKGIELEMLWPDSPPIHDKLRLFVRFTTEDGRRLQADSTIFIEVPESHTAGWIPKPQTPSSNTRRRTAREARLPTRAQRPSSTLTPCRGSTGPKVRMPTPIAAVHAEGQTTVQEPIEASVARPVWSPER